MKSFELEYNYDYTYDLVDMVIKEDYKHKESIELANGVILDFDENNIPVALEIISASKILNTEKKNLIHPIIQMFISVNEDLINLEVIFTYKVHNKEEPISIEKNIANNYNIPNIETMLSTV